MEGAVSMLRGEQRRHLLLNAGLVAACFVGGTVVTNERGLFVPIGFDGISSTAQAFATMLSPARFLHPDRMLRHVRLASLDPFDVTADPRDLRHRLMDAMEGYPEQATDFNKQVAAMGGNLLTPTELDSDEIPGSGGSGSGGGGGGGSGASSGDASTPSPLTSSGNDLLPGNRGLVASGPDGTTDVPATGGNTGGGGATTAVPEPSAWAMLLVGFGLVGWFQRLSLRRRERKSAARA